jgi:hypothetical protein
VLKELSVNELTLYATFDCILRKITTPGNRWFYNRVLDGQATESWDVASLSAMATIDEIFAPDSKQRTTGFVFTRTQEADDIWSLPDILSILPTKRKRRVVGGG